MKKIIAVSAFLATSIVGALSGGGPGAGGATEVTQIANNGELMTMVGQQAESVSEAIKQTLTQIDSYKAQVRNILPVDQVQAYLAPYEEQKKQLTTLYTAVNSVATSSNTVQGYITQNVKDMAATGLSPADYLKYMTSMSKTQGGAYKQKLTGEVAALGDFQKRAEQLQKVQANIPGIDGQIQGLNNLNQLTGMAAGEIMGMHAAIRQQIIAQDQKELAKNQRDEESSNTLLLFQQGRDADVDSVIGAFKKN